MSRSGFLIGLTGRKGSGKDTAAYVLTQDPRLGFHKAAFADALRDIVRIAFGLSDLELHDRVLKEKPLDRWPYQSPRHLLQFVGTDLFRENWPDVWIHALRHRILSRPHQNYVITDVRFPNEADMIRSMGGSVIRIVRPSLFTSPDEHISETLSDSISVDATITNSGSVDELQDAARLCVLELYGRTRAGHLHSEPQPKS